MATGIAAKVVTRGARGVCAGRAVVSENILDKVMGGLRSVAKFEIVKFL